MNENKNKEKFEEISSDTGIIAEFWELLKENKKFWLLPLAIILLLLGLIIVLGSTSAAPFIYTLF